MSNRLPILAAEIQAAQADFAKASALAAEKTLAIGAALQEKGLGVEVINLHTIKPLDEEAILNSIRKTRCAVTAEEHNIYGGMGDAVAQVAAKHFPIPIEYVGTRDTFGESGTPDQLLKKYGLDVPDIIRAAEKVMARKKG